MNNEKNTKPTNQITQTEPHNTNKRNPSSCIRFSKNEYKKIKDATEITGKSIPELLKSAYFKNPVTNPLVCKKDAKELSAQIKRIGNNVNQIAKRMNSGVYQGWYDDFQTFNKNFTDILCWLANIKRSKACANS